MTSFAHTGNTFEKLSANEMCWILSCTSSHKLLIDIIYLTVFEYFAFKSIYDVISVKR